MSEVTKTECSACIDPRVLYTLPEFKRAAGLGETTIRNARRRGIELQTMRVGRRKFVRGLAAIRFIEALST